MPFLLNIYPVKVLLTHLKWKQILSPKVSSIVFEFIDPIDDIAIKTISDDIWIINGYVIIENWESIRLFTVGREIIKIKLKWTQKISGGEDFVYLVMPLNSIDSIRLLSFNIKVKLNSIWAGNTPLAQGCITIR